jgi:L-asparaginase
MTQQIMVLGTGGTIAGTAASATDNVGYIAAQIGVETLLQSVPGLDAALQGRELVAEQVAQLDSKDMDFDVMLRLARRCMHFLAQQDVKGIVITHGTDTLEETAYFLHRVIPLELQVKPVVLTCAMRPATSGEADGPSNLRDAVRVASDAQASGVLAVCAGDVHHALSVQKVHSYALNAFSSGDVAQGELGLLAQVVPGQINWILKTLTLLKAKQRLEHLQPALRAIYSIASHSALDLTWPRVEIVLNHSQASGHVVRALLAASQAHDPLRGIVVAGTGNGTVSLALQAALDECQTQGVQVVFASRCAWGGVRCSYVESSDIAGSALSAVKARIELVLSLLR